MKASTGAQAAVPAGDEVAAAHARMLADKTLQFDLTAVAPDPPPPDWLSPFLVLSAAAPAMQWVFWGGLALVALLIVFYIGKELIHLRWPGLGKKAKAAPTPEWRPSAAQALALLDDADRLAADGRFAEAVRALLFRSIDDIQGRRPNLLRPALTSRDIAALDALPERAREPFAGIARTVERSFFGGREVSAADFTQCRDAYEAFAFPEAWS